MALEEDPDRLRMKVAKKLRLKDKKTSCLSTVF